MPEADWLDFISLLQPANETSRLGFCPTKHLDTSNSTDAAPKQRLLLALTMVTMMMSRARSDVLRLYLRHAHYGKSVRWSHR